MMRHMAPLVGKGRVPLMTMFGLLALSIPPFVLAEASLFVVAGFGFIVTILCCFVGAMRITREHQIDRTES